MSATGQFDVRSPLSLAVLTLLFERPMHPYLMHKLIIERGKDKVVNVRSRNSVQQTVTRLERAGLVAAGEPERGGNRPARTVYHLTDAGRATLLSALHQELARPAAEYPKFAAALSFMAATTVEAATTTLAERRDRLTERIEHQRAQLASGLEVLPGILLIEDDYSVAMLEAERDWIDRTLAALRGGELRWDAQLLIDTANEVSDLESNPRPLSRF